jgi:hypothetical protein
MTNRSKNTGEFRTKWLQIAIYLHTASLLPYVSSVPTLCEQNQLVIRNGLNFATHRLCK